MPSRPCPNSAHGSAPIWKATSPSSRSALSAPSPSPSQAPSKTKRRGTMLSCPSLLDHSNGIVCEISHPLAKVLKLEEDVFHIQLSCQLLRMPYSQVNPANTYCCPDKSYLQHP